MTSFSQAGVHFLRVPYLVMGLGLAICIARPAPAINITMVFNGGASEAPSFDPAGTALNDLFDYAELFYQDVFEDTHNITINFWYEDLDGLLGVHSLVNQGGAPNRETEANIRIDTRVGLGGAVRDWFIDPTPDGNTEFTMQQTLWRDLNATQQSDFFNNFGANIPDTFETAFTGTATAGGGAAGITDMLSVVLHEVGHALGMSSANNSTIAQTGDLDYDFNSAFVFGQTLAAEVADGSNIAHLDNASALMTPSIGTGIRRLPSHTDLFSMASGHFYANLDVPRREYYGGTDWNTDGNWSGDTVPGIADDTYVRNPGSIVTSNLSANGFAGNLFVSEGGNVDTESFKLDVADTVTISDLDSDIFVQTGGELEASTIRVENDAELNVNGGLVDAITIQLIQGTTSTYLQGTGGTIDVQTTLNNNATVRASFGGSLTFTSSGAAVWDLDGTTGNGVVQAVVGDLNFASGSMLDAFDGSMDIGDATAVRTLTMAEPWSLGAGGVIDMAGGALVAERAQLNGGTMTATAGNVNAIGIAHINAPVVLGGSVNVNAADGGVLEFNGATSVGSGDFNASTTGQIELEGVTTYTGGSVNVAGVVQQNADASVVGATTIAGSRFDLDGDTGAGVDWTVSNGAFVLNVDSIESAGAGGFFDGSITVNSSILVPASLTVNLTGDVEWTMAGTLNTNGAADPFIVSTIGAGTPFNLTGTANVSGNGSWNARVDISGTINTVNAASTLRLTGGTLADPNRLQGGSILGPGTLSATVNDALVGFGTISTRVNFLNDAELRADNGTLNLTGVINDVGIIGTADADGILNVGLSWNTSVANRLELLGGEVTGASITNDGLTSGNGQITANDFVNNAVTSAVGGTLVLNSTTFPDLDGVSETGVINAVDGNVLVPGVFGFTFAFDGTIHVGNGRTFRMPATSIQNAGTVNLTSGELSALGVNHVGILNVNPGISTLTELGNGIQFLNASVTNLNGDLNLVGNSLIAAGASISGPRNLIVPAGSTLRIANGAVVDAGIHNSGRAEVGTSPGIALVDSFTQTAAGTYEAEIDGVLVGTQYDQLQVTGNATLAGTLDVLINQNGGAYADPAVPGTFHAFTLIAAGSVSPDFDTVNYAGAALVPEFAPEPDGDFVSLASCGLFRIMDYSATDVQLINYRALSGDANGDGSVDGSDFNLWNSSKFLVGTDWSTGDFNCDGSTDGTDFNIWNANKFTSVALPRTADTLLVSQGLSVGVVPEPTGWFLMACGLCSLAAVRRRPGPRPWGSPGDRTP